jgi:hypothetical protein
MFKPQPVRHAAVFAVTIFGVSVIVTLFTLRSLLSAALALQFFYLGALAVGALLSGLFFWLGLGFSHRVPATGKAALFAAFSYFTALNVLQTFGGTVTAQWVSFGVLLVVPFILGARWPERWSVASPHVPEHAG